MFRDGSSEITAGKIEGNAICTAGELQELPWEGQVCQYTGSSPHSYYYRLSLEQLQMLGTKLSGPIYLHLLNAVKEDENLLTVKFASAQKFAAALKPAELGKGPWGFLGDDESESTMYEFGSGSVIKAIGNATPCYWAFEHLNELP